MERERERVREREGGEVCKGWQEWWSKRQGLKRNSDRWRRGGGEEERIGLCTRSTTNNKNLNIFITVFLWVQASWREVYYETNTQRQISLFHEQPVSISLTSKGSHKVAKLRSKFQSQFRSATVSPHREIWRCRLLYWEKLGSGLMICVKITYISPSYRQWVIQPEDMTGKLRFARWCL